MRWSYSSCLMVMAVVVAYTAAIRSAQAQTHATPPEPSVSAPLAEQSLLLDVAGTDGRLVVVGERGHVLVSTDQAASWTQVVVPARSMLNAVTLLAGGQGWAVGHDATILHTADGGDSWTLQHWAPEFEQPLFDVWFADARQGFAIGAYGLYLETRDGGTTWVRRSVDEDEPHLYHVASGGGDTLFMAGEFGSIYRSDDAGTTWAKSVSPYPGSFFGALAVDERTVMVFGLRGNLFRSRDGGRNWTAVSSGTTTGLFDAIRRDDGLIVLAGQGGLICVSRDGGETFTARHLGTRDAISSMVPLDGDRILLVGESGITVLESLDHPMAGPDGDSP